MRILLIDESLMTEMVLRRALRGSDRPHQITRSADPRSLLVDLTKRYDVIVSDLSLSWLETRLLGRLLSFHQPDVPLVIYSGPMTQCEREGLRELNFVSWIAKSEQAQRLVRSLTRHAAWQAEQRAPQRSLLQR